MQIRAAGCSGLGLTCLYLPAWARQYARWGHRLPPSLRSSVGECSLDAKGRLPSGRHRVRKAELSRHFTRCTAQWHQQARQTWGKLRTAPAAGVASRVTILLKASGSAGGSCTAASQVLAAAEAHTSSARHRQAGSERDGSSGDAPLLRRPRWAPSRQCPHRSRAGTLACRPRQAQALWAGQSCALQKPWQASAPEPGCQHSSIAAPRGVRPAAASPGGTAVPAWGGWLACPRS